MKQFTSIEVIAIITAIGVFLTPLGVLLVSVINALRKKVDEVDSKAATIVGHVNSEATAAKGREITLRAENEILRTIVEDQKATAALLAQALALRAPASAELQKEIAANTRETADNTHPKAAPQGPAQG